MQAYSSLIDPFFSKYKFLNVVDIPGYPLYPPNQDIYQRSIKVEDIDFENISPKKNKNWEEESFEMPTKDAHTNRRINEVGITCSRKKQLYIHENDPFGEDLDVPGADLDDDQEAIGNEDEENNSYSLAQDEQSDDE